MKKYPNLSKPITIRGVTYRNRIFSTPTGLTYPDEYSGQPDFRTVLFYEPKVKKFNSINEDLYKFKHLSLTSKKKNYFPKIVHNHYQSFNVSLSVRDENKRFFQYIENKKSRNQKQKQPIKLLSIDTESISDTLNSYSMSKTFKSFNKENF